MRPDSERPISTLLFLDPERYRNRYSKRVYSLPVVDSSVGAILLVVLFAFQEYHHRAQKSASIGTKTMVVVMIDYLWLP